LTSTPLSEALQARARCGDVLAVGELVMRVWDPQWFHAAKATLLNEAIRFARFKGARGGIPRVLISEPRRHGKTTFASELMPATLLGCWPEGRVTTTAYNEGLVSEMVEHTRGFMNHPAYQATFPVRLSGTVDPTTGRSVQAKDAAAYFKTLRVEPSGAVVPAGGSYYAVGIGGGMTGRGLDCGVIDDWTKTLDEAISPAHQRKLENTYDTCFASSIEGVASLVGVQTRWRRGDFMEWLHSTWTSEGYDVPWLQLSKLYDPELRRDVSVMTLDGRSIKIVDPRSCETSLWESKFPTLECLRRRDSLVKRGRLWLWDAQDQQGPTSQGGAIFPRERWRWYDKTFDLSTIQELHISVDPNSKATGRSFGCVGVWGVVDHPKYGVSFFRLDEARGHWDFPALRAAVAHIADKWITALPKAARNPRSKIWVEDKANGPALLAETAPEILALRPWLMPVPKGRSKEACYREAKGIIDRDPDGDACVWLPLESFGRTESGAPLVTADWTTGEGGFVDECYAQQPLSEPNDRPDEMAQILICRVFGPERLTYC
jgi:hypothetical protein